MGGKVIKLVRDFIPALMEHNGQTLPRTWVADEREFAILLRAKLVEEVDEYLESGSALELADVLEVLIAIAGTQHDRTPTDIMKMADEKREARGGFEDRIVMEFDDDTPSTE